MLSHRVRFVFRMILIVLFSIVARATEAKELLVFISAFAKEDKGAIHAYQLDLDAGTLKQIHRTAGMEHPFFMALSKDRKHLYSIHAPKQFGGKENEQVAAYELEGLTGKMKLLNRQSTRGTASCYLDIDATGKSVLVANYSSGSVASLPVQADGSLGESVSFFEHAGSSVDKGRQGESHAHCFVVSPDNRFAYAADLGIDQVLCYQLDSATAKLTPGRHPFVRTPPGAGPRHLIFDSQAKHVYVINELKNSVTVFNYDAASGMLAEVQTISTLPAGFTGTSHCADLKITPDGRYLYGTNRGHDSIAAYKIEPDGKLVLVDISPSLGKGPQNLAITPNGQLLICANMAGDNVAVFKIDTATGKLKSMGKPIEMPGPSCIQIP